MSKPHLSFRPKAELADAIRAAALEERRPVSQFLANLIEDALAAKIAPNPQPAQASQAA
ncbi:hypothetical protein [Bradyrhizobium hipponense]|uniref:hypothetical protein n=1 Tax=Bradyrhizobium hipponense TaxID=2605638 RepID=UPI00165333AE|nr:hypothetical protein [Bradyrhizobium hipponense]